MENTVLVVDDSKTVRTLIVNVLESSYHVLEAENGRDALELLRNPQNNISVVITDLMMPEMDGYQFLEAYSSSPEFANIPVIVLTSETDYKSEITCLEYGALDFIRKPSSPQGILFRVKNVIERSSLYLLKKLHYQEQFDTLTGLYQKKVFVYRTQKILKENPDTDFMLLYLDIYRFHLYNNVFGNRKGDELLCHIADIIREMETDGKYMTYCRMGVDTFCICMPVVDRDAVKVIADDFQQDFRNYQSQYHILANWGAFYIRDREEPITDMIDHARLASKMCKGDHIQNVCIYTECMGESLRETQNLVNGMEQAIREEQFVLYLQPKYRLSNYELDGAEVLVRWITSEKGMISPGKFIPVFERNGLIMKLDYYVWEQSCKLIRHWLDEGLEPPPISVNISRISLYNPRIAEEIYTLTVKYNVPPELFQLELTESAYTDNPDTIPKTMRTLQELGFTILMDDFGSGYSSLNVLRDLPVDVLKLDMKFMAGSNGGGRDKGSSILANVVRLAKDLHLPVVAEGVENAKQMEFLNSIGCEYGQGYYFAKPMPVEEYEKLAFCFLS